MSDEDYDDDEEDRSPKRKSTSKKNKSNSKAKDEEAMKFTAIFRPKIDYITTSIARPQAAVVTLVTNRIAKRGAFGLDVDGDDDTGRGEKKQNTDWRVLSVIDY